MHIVICDDDDIFRSQLSRSIQSFFKERKLDLPVLTFYADGRELLESNDYGDILFLDIEMPEMNGIDAGNRIKKINPNCIVIVITAYDTYLDDAMRFHVFRYLSKPLNENRLFLNLQDALALYATLERNFMIRTDTGLVCFSSAEILMIEAANHGCFIETLSGRYYSPVTIEQ